MTFNSCPLSQLLMSFANCIPHLLNLAVFSAIIWIMISIKINDINNFMQNILVQDTFDSFLISEGEISTSNTFTFNGSINKNFYDTNELGDIYEDFIFWKQLKHICFEIIRGKKVPTHMKLIFALPKNSYRKIIGDSGMNISVDSIGGLYLHVLYENNQITVITGTSLNIFTMDKTLDKYWDNIMKNFLNKYFDTEEI